MRGRRLARTGLRPEGRIAGLFIATEKLAFATNPLVAGLVLQATGFRGGEAINAGMTQNSTAVMGVITVSCLLPAAMTWLAILPAIGCARSLRTLLAPSGRQPAGHVVAIEQP